MSMTTDKVSEYQERLAALHDSIREWLSNSEIDIQEEPVQIVEEGVEPYMANALSIRDQTGKLLATLKPMGTNIIGAEGQVRLMGSYDMRIITYFVDAGPTIEIEEGVNGVPTGRHPRPLFSGLGRPDWYVITDPRTGETHHLDEALFKSLLTEVSDYEE